MEKLNYFKYSLFPARLIYKGGAEAPKFDYSKAVGESGKDYIKGVEKAGEEYKRKIEKPEERKVDAAVNGIMEAYNNWKKRRKKAVETAKVLKLVEKLVYKGDATRELSEKQKKEVYRRVAENIKSAEKQAEAPKEKAREKGRKMVERLKKVPRIEEAVKKMPDEVKGVGKSRDLVMARDMAAMRLRSNIMKEVVKALDLPVKGTYRMEMSGIMPSYRKVEGGWEAYVKLSDSKKRSLVKSFLSSYEKFASAE